MNRNSDLLGSTYPGAYTQQGYRTIIAFPKNIKGLTEECLDNNGNDHAEVEEEDFNMKNAFIYLRICLEENYMYHTPDWILFAMFHLNISDAWVLFFFETLPVIKSKQNLTQFFMGRLNKVIDSSSPSPQVCE